MSDNTAAATEAPVESRKKSRIAALMLGVAALILWFGSRATWLTVDVFDDLSGASTHELVGATWSAESTAIALMLLVALIAGLALRRIGRRIVGIVAALGSVLATWTPLTLLAGEPDPARAHDLLSSGAASQLSTDPVSISSWAEIINLEVSTFGPVMTMIGGAIGLFGGVLLAMRPGGDSPKLNKYERKAARRERLQDDLATSPDSGRVMWDALDDDIDPTDLSTPVTEPSADDEGPDSSKDQRS